MSAAQHRITKEDVLSPSTYARERSVLRKRLIQLKKNRRVEVGPYVTFYFENYDTMWQQVHEMVHIEKGGEDQFTDEIAVYNPLIPQGRELIATMMIEVDNPIRRVEILKQL